VLYLGPYWVGILTYLTTDKVPISRLTSSDLTKRAGAITALLIIIAIVALIVVNQSRVIRKTGWLPYYAGWYALGGLTALVLSQMPGLELRLHHYILGMIFMPGTGDYIIDIASGSGTYVCHRIPHKAIRPLPRLSTGSVFEWRRSLWI
jgi:hypothetical protein